MDISVEDAWASLKRPEYGLTARMCPGSAQVRLALDSMDRRHLLVRASTELAGTTLMSTRGLQAITAQLSVESGALDVWADISCTDRSLNRTFLALAADLVSNTADSTDPLLAVQKTLRTWRWFWGIDAAGLSETGALGLFGEIWFLDRWAPFPSAVATWHGADKDRHDFSSSSVAVEVKTSRSHGVGAPRHHVATLDQLEAPEGAPLYLFSLQAIPESNAGNTLSGLVKRVRARLADRVDLLSILDEGLASWGWSPVEDPNPTAYRVAAERLYRVDISFPKLTRATFSEGLPPGVDDVSYSIDTAVCADWLVASSPTDAETILAELS